LHFEWKFYILKGRKWACAQRNAGMEGVERLKGKRLIAGILAVFLLGTTAVAAAPYDVQRHWSGSAVNTLLEHDVVHGYPNGRYYPDRAITREEAAQLLALLIQTVEKETPTVPEGEEPPTSAAPDDDLPSEELPQPTGEVEPAPRAEDEAVPENSSGAEEEEPSQEQPENPQPGEEPAEKPEPIVFTDVEETRWSKPAIDFLTQRGSISGYPDGTFRPAASITRAEFSNMIYHYLTKGGTAEETVPSGFPDVTEESFAYAAICYLYAHQIVTGCSDGTFRPNQSLTRAEAAVMLLRLTDWEVIPVQVVLPAKTVISVPYISQLYPVYAVVGCEATSLLMALKGKGYAQNVTLRQFLDEMPKSKSDPAKGFVGSPYVADKTKKTRTTIYPPVLAAYASKYGEVVDFSGKTPEDIQFEVLNGNPVVIYATMRWETPYYRWYNIEGQQQRLLSNNHAVLICGYDSTKDSYYIADPYNVNNTRKEYRYWISASKLEPIYNVRRHAVVVR
jgi:uncharacterized protein YvpB